MTVDLCLEASGAVAHLVGPDTVNAVLPVRLRWRGRRPTHAAGPAVAGPAVAAMPTVSFEARLGAAIDRLPIALVHVLWLIDVCRCSYEAAAIELGTSPDRIEAMVSQARRRLRLDLERSSTAGPEPPTAPGRGSGGSTSRSRPGWPRPGR